MTKNRVRELEERMETKEREERRGNIIREVKMREDKKIEAVKENYEGNRS